jgi:methylase of polypeptide subunit release factors
LKEHIYLKRKPLDEIKQRLNENGFVIKEIDEDKFYLRFAGGTALFNHSFIKYWFLDSWKKIVNKNDVERIFENIERKLNKLADGNGEVRLTIPYATIDCEKN